MEIAKLVLDYLSVLVWPAVVIAMGLVYRNQLISLLGRIRHAELPGGIAVDLHDEIEEARRLSAKVEEEPSDKYEKRGPSIPLTEANARMLNLNLRPSPSGLDMSYYQHLAEQDPTLALAGLRIEIDVLARNIASGFQVQVQERDSGARLVRRLFDAGAITSDQMELTMKVLRVCNAAIHGAPMSHGEAEKVIRAAEILTEQFLNWLSWGFDDGWSPGADQSGQRGPQV